MGDMHEALFFGKLNSSGGGSCGTTDYADLTNKPQINGVTLNGNKSTSDLGIDEIWKGTQARYISDPPAEGQAYIITDDTDIDTTPTQNSSNPITSGGVYTAIAAINATIGDINTVLEGVL